ncbi:MAG TPA: purine-nucleoside phosphorylase [Longimicrobiales bacterium]|nr:purine-nucleoside phosphorylase [Longimicrobiales bacterium]
MSSRPGTDRGGADGTPAQADPLLPEAVHSLRNRLPALPETVVVLGSGLSGLADAMEEAVAVPFAEVRGFPPTAVEGHAARYVFGELEGRRVLLQAGRFHFYEGHPPRVVALPIRVAHALGAGSILLTNAAGAVDRRLAPGDLVLLDDHVNLQWRSVLKGPVRPGEGRFPDMSAPWDPDLQALALAAARELGLPLGRGIYAAVLGPSYETSAEVRMLERLGVDVVGMSTVPEAMVARALGLPVAGFSLVTNRVAGPSHTPLSHTEVLEAGRRGGAILERLLRRVIRDLPPS